MQAKSYSLLLFTIQTLVHYYILKNDEKRLTFLQKIYIVKILYSQAWNTFSDLRNKNCTCPPKTDVFREYFC